MTKSINDAKHWHDRAAEMRAIADTMSHRDTVDTMNRLADDYDKMGERADERAAAEQLRAEGRKVR